MASRKVTNFMERRTDQPPWRQSDGGAQSDDVVDRLILDSLACRVDTRRSRPRPLTLDVLGMAEPLLHASTAGLERDEPSAWMAQACLAPIAASRLPPVSPAIAHRAEVHQSAELAGTALARCCRLSPESRGLGSLNRACHRVGIDGRHDTVHLGVDCVLNQRPGPGIYWRSTLR